jgi:6-phosphogluconolactonase
MNETWIEKTPPSMRVLAVLPDRQRLIEATAEHVVELASQAIGENGMFTVALSGGSTPRPLYTLLAKKPFIKRIDWSRVHLFWGDERCVPPDDPQSNYRMVRETLLAALAVPPEHIHRIQGEEEPESAAARYEQVLQTFFGSIGKNHPPRATFDLVLLGMGDDGHTASLFPGSPAVTEERRWVLPQYVEAVSMWRITLTPAAINAAKNTLFMVSGSGKAEALRAVLEGPLQAEVLPAQAIHPVNGRLLWLADEAAASRLKDAQGADRSTKGKK